MSEVRLQIEEALTALQNNDTQGAMMNLDLALNTLGGAAGAQGNMTSTAGGNATNATTILLVEEAKSAKKKEDASN